MAANKVKIVNKTDWSTRDIRKLVSVTMKMEGVDNKRRKIHVIHTKRKIKLSLKKIIEEGEIITIEHLYNGWTYLNSTVITLTVPRPVEQVHVYRMKHRVRMTFNSVEFARTLIHELGHTLGMDHDVMIPASDIECPWARKFRVRPRKIPTSGLRFRK